MIYVLHMCITRHLDFGNGRLLMTKNSYSYFFFISAYVKLYYRGVRCLHLEIVLIVEKYYFSDR